MNIRKNVILFKNKRVGDFSSLTITWRQALQYKKRKMGGEAKGSLFRIEILKQVKNNYFEILRF